MNCKITEFGAVESALCTAAFRGAAEACRKNGGGTILVPPGTWTTGSFRLFSGTELHLEAGAVVRASGDIADYEPLPLRDVPKINSADRSGDVLSLVWAMDAETLAITGPGEFDLNAEVFMDRGRLCGGSIPPTEAEKAECHCTPKPDRPNRMFFFHRCGNIAVSRVTLRNSPAWTLVFSCSHDLRVSGIRIENSLTIPNDDGIHFCGCRNAEVARCAIRSGDDCVAFTAITDFNSPMTGGTVSECVLTSASSAIRIGGRGGTFRNFSIHDCEIVNTNRGFVVFAGDKATVDDVRIQNIAIETHLFYGCWWGKGEPFALIAMPGGKIRNVSVSGLSGSAENSIVAYGDVEGLRLQNIRLKIGYGTHRPAMGDRIDLSPAPNLPAPDAREQIPWLWTQISQAAATQKIEIAGDGRFSTKAMVK